MKRNLVGVTALSIAALLFAGCGAGSKMSPAQKERCDELKSKKADAESKLSEQEQLIGDPKKILELKTQLDGISKERAALGC